jgi:hypothetical protein
MNLDFLTRNIKGVLQIIIGICYLGLGSAVIVKKWFLTIIESKTAWALGMLLILYGVFRVYRAFISFKEESS